MSSEVCCTMSSEVCCTMSSEVFCAMSFEAFVLCCHTGLKCIVSCRVKSSMLCR